MNKKYKLKQGDMVVMHTCMEHDSPENFGKIWTCRSDEFKHKGHDYGSIFLDGFSGSFSTEFLQKVNITESLVPIGEYLVLSCGFEVEQFKPAIEVIGGLRKELVEAQQTIATLRSNADHWEGIALRLADSVESLNRKDIRLRKALETISNPPFIIGSTALQHMQIARDALGIKEGDNKS